MARNNRPLPKKTVSYHLGRGTHGGAPLLQFTILALPVERYADSKGLGDLEGLSYGRPGRPAGAVAVVTVATWAPPE